MSSHDLELRALDESHAEKMLQWMCTPEVAENIGLRAEPSLPRTLAWITKARDSASVQAWTIYFADRHVGNVVLDEIETYLKSSRISIYLGEPTARGHGLGSAALREAVTRGFGELGLHRIWLTVHEHNTRAFHLYSRIGFRFEGLLRDSFLLRGQRVNAILMSMLEGELTP